MGNKQYYYAYIMKVSAMNINNLLMLAQEKEGILSSVKIGRDRIYQNKRLFNLVQNGR
jgi:hypothetical protein